MEIENATEFGEVVPEPSTAPRAGEKWGIRAAAYIIDAVFVFGQSFTIQFVLGLVIGLARVLTGGRMFSGGGLEAVPSTIIGLAQSVAYFTIFEWLAGATVGKLILGMRVVKASGAPCTLGAAIVRGLLRIIDALFFTLPAVLSMKAPLYQRLGDKAARTVVVKARGTRFVETRPWWMFLVAAAIYLTINVLVSLVIVLGTL
jgi:uncharacterized RDD family membrane protein YckC